MTLNELTLTTNGTQLARFADELASCGVRRINVSLDTLDQSGRFRRSPAAAISSARCWPASTPRNAPGWR